MNTQNDISTFAHNVASTRSRMQLSQTQVSGRSGIHTSEISRIERGLRDARLTTIVRLARAMDVAPARLLDGIQAKSLR